LLFGISIYVIASSLCAFAPSIDFLIAGRALQGVGAGAGLAIGGAIVRDMHSGDKAIRLLAARTLVIGASPLIAPVLGALIIAGGSWRNIFLSHVAFGLLALAAILLIPETLDFDRRCSAPFHRVFSTYAKLVRNRAFITYVVSAAFVQAALVAYIAGSPLVFLTIAQVSPLQYGLIFAGNGLVFVLAAQISPFLTRWRGPVALIRLTLLAQTIICLLIALAGLANLLFLPVLLFLLLVFQACVGAVGAPTVVLALSDQRSMAGTASGFMVFHQLAFGAAASALVAGFPGPTAVPMAIIMAGASAGALVAAVLSPATSETGFPNIDAL
jgi:DHA1 family bicyclomycin/chloramphenicol resistance-like MFS transporter